MILADIAHGHTGPADVLFLIAAICAGVAALLAMMTPPTVPTQAARALGLAALCLVAVGFLLL